MANGNFYAKALMTKNIERDDQYFKYIDHEPPNIEVRHGLVARIPGSHPGGPGSIPGVGMTFCFLSQSFER